MQNCLRYIFSWNSPFLYETKPFSNQSSEIKMQESTDNFSMIKRPTHNAI